jgi:hypothetical protein
LSLPGTRGPFVTPKRLDVMAERHFTVWHSVRDEHGNYSWCVNDGLFFARTPFGHKATIGRRFAASLSRPAFGEGIKRTREVR